ncbi:tRNA(His) guanylyltransferase Thg1 family protein [Streptosporangium oxazolinicum]|uniref:tRNA(His) guanylyltransferase Thg1 family protein n=1 Tax=Streptosporangium oxazolinicum TaxID=909287 RepID=A0ABP8BMD1_9ACTN
MTTDSLGDRMKRYEATTRAVLPPRTYTILRVDGRAFHTFLRHAERPFDDRVMDCMDEVGKALCAEISGSVLAYTQSDECSVLITDFTSHGTQPWFGGVVQKMTSIAASLATVAFNEAYATPYGGRRALFDARVFTLSSPVEVANYFLWRQRDCVRNSITMAAQAVFSHRDLHRKSTDDMQNMLWAEGINWNNYPDGAKRGRVCTRRAAEQATISSIRSWWETQAAPHFTAEPDSWLASTIPTLPTLTPGDHPQK